MKIFLMFLGLCLSLAGGAIAAEKVEAPKSCQQCGMDREVFAQSRMMITYADGTRVGECSLNCAVVGMKANKGKKVTALMVADYGTKKLIDARKATWVVGGKKSGVMTSMPKWAFAGASDAQRFVRENGGRVTNFDEALNLAVKENE
jgi:copper chaperone NosL